MPQVAQSFHAIFEGLLALVSPRHREQYRQKRLMQAQESALAELRRLGAKVFRIAGGLNIHLSHAVIRNQELALLGKVSELKELRLMGTKISNDGLAHLARITTLTMLDLRQTEVGDEGLTHLRGLKNLETLDLEGTRVTDAGVENLKIALPRVHVVRSTK